MIFLHIEWCIGKCPGLYTIIFKTFTWYLSLCIILQLFRLRSGGFKYTCTNIKFEIFQSSLTEWRFISNDVTWLVYYLKWQQVIKLATNECQSAMNSYIVSHVDNPVWSEWLVWSTTQNIPYPVISWRCILIAH